MLKDRNERVCIMSEILIRGGNRLCGSITVQGAKNSALPMLAATVLTEGKSVIHNCPDISDVASTVKILKEIGAEVERDFDSHIITVDASNVSGYEVSECLMREMRSSIMFLGAIIGRFGKARLCFPGGCELGPRPIDLHLSALNKLGVNINEHHGFIDCDAANGLRGAEIMLSFPSVGATENIILASVLAKGRTVIHNAAREPEIVDLACYLNKCGARISNMGESTVFIDGVDRLHGAEHSVIPDRIVAATYIAATAAAGGEIELTRIVPTDMSNVISVFCEMGCEISLTDDSLRLRSDKALNRVHTVRTMPYPGFPTDSAAPLIAALAVANGTTMVVENIFANRYNYVDELKRMGADIKVEERVAVIEGVRRLHGANVNCTDLRGGAAMLIAGLCAEGETVIGEIHHIDRGYESPEKILRSVGADIRRQ